MYYLRNVRGFYQVIPLPRGRFLLRLTCKPNYKLEVIARSWFGFDIIRTSPTIFVTFDKLDVGTFGQLSLFILSV